MPDPTFIPPQEVPTPGMPPTPFGGSDPGAGTGAPDLGATGQSSPLASPDQKQQLLDLIGQIRAQLGQFHAIQFAGTNKAQQQRMDLLKEIFAELQSAGVDLQDPQSVSAFIAKLRAQSPDMADLFEQAMGQLLGGDPGQTSGQGQDQMMPPSGQMPMDMNNGTQDPTTPPPQG